MDTRGDMYIEEIRVFNDDISKRTLAWATGGFCGVLTQEGIDFEQTLYRGNHGNAKYVSPVRPITFV